MISRRLLPPFHRTLRLTVGEKTCTNTSWLLSMQMSLALSLALSVGKMRTKLVNSIMEQISGDLDET